MSSIARNPRGGLTGKGGHFENKFSEQIAQALAIQMNLSTHRQANEKVLGALRKTAGVHCSLKEAVQARTQFMTTRSPRNSSEIRKI